MQFRYDINFPGNGVKNGSWMENTAAILFCQRREAEEREAALVARRESAVLRHAMLADWYAAHAKSLAGEGDRLNPSCDTRE